MQQKIENRSLELLHIHNKYGHVPFARLREMAKQGIIPKYHATTPTPACAACLYGRATRRQWRFKTPQNKQKSTLQATKPGQYVSVDMLYSPSAGFVAQITGILTTKRYNYITVYIDHYSGYGYVHFQKSSDVTETLQSKHAFELHAKQHGVSIEAYHADNGIFRANQWVQDCQSKYQQLTFAAVNAHHQNGKAERRIRLLQELTQTRLIHLSHKCRAINSVNLWPYAIRIANSSLNHTPNMLHKHKSSAAQLFSGSSINHNPQHHRPVGCPTYVLEQPLQNRMPFAKWKHRAKLGFYLGPSPHHARNVSLVLNLQTGLVSPQFHVAHDSTFQTVRDVNTQYPWAVKAGLIKSTLSQLSHKRSQEPKRKHTRSKRMRTTSIQPSEVATSSTKPSEANPSEGPKEIPTLPSTNSNGSHMGSSQPEPASLKRSSRVRKPTQRLITAMIAEINTPSEGVLPQYLVLPSEEHISGELFAVQSLFPDYNSYFDDNPRFAMKAASDHDTMYYHEAMRTPDRAHFIQAMENEMNANLKSKNFELVHRSTIPQDATILPSVWQLRRKRHLSTGKIKKYEARINVDGSKQIKDKHYDLTYAPVASWSIIRLILTIAAVKKWPTKQLDHVLAFPQKIPKGYQVQDANSKDYVLKFNNNLYGQKQAGRVWNQFLTEKLQQVGYSQSKYDQCIFYRKNVIYIIYTGDSIITGPSTQEIDEAIAAIKKTKLQITEEGDVQDFLGVNITCNNDGSIKFHQPLLIDTILKDLNLPKDGQIREIPAKSSSILSRHTTSKDHDSSFDYRSIIGKLGSLEKGSLPEIAYIVHQCARFSIAPEIEHARAIRWLARYLRGTRDQGITICTQIYRNVSNSSWTLTFLEIGIQQTLTISIPPDHVMVML